MLNMALVCRIKSNIRSEFTGKKSLYFSKISKQCVLIPLATCAGIKFSHMISKTFTALTPGFAVKESSQQKWSTGARQQAQWEDREMNKMRGWSQINSLLCNSLSWMQTTNPGQSMEERTHAHTCTHTNTNTHTKTNGTHRPHCYRQVKATSVCLDRWQGLWGSVWNMLSTWDTHTHTLTM